MRIRLKTFGHGNSKVAMNFESCKFPGKYAPCSAVVVGSPDEELQQAKVATQLRGILHLDRDLQ